MLPSEKNGIAIRFGQVAVALLVFLAAGALAGIAVATSTGSAASASYYYYCPDGAAASNYGYCPPANAAPVYTPPADQAADEGASTNFDLGSFSDANGNGPWQVVVTWGDASAPETFSRSSAGALPQRAHTYDDNGTYTVTVTVTDAAGASDTDTFHVVVANVAPSATFNAQTPVDEGSAIELSLTGGSDPSSADTAAGFTYAFDCGAGFGEFAPTNAASCPTSDNGSRAVRGRIRDKDGGVSEYSAQVTVANVAPTVTAAAGQSADEGASVAFVLGSFADPGADSPWAVNVTWGDGSAASSFDRATTGALPATGHTYADNGVYTVTVRVTDKDGASDSESFLVTVANVAPTATLNAPASVDEGSAIALSLTGASDPSPVDTAAGFEYAFDCGSGFGPFGTSASASCPTADNGVRTVRGRIRDKDGGVSEYQASVSVQNVAPSLGAITAPLSPVAVGTAINASASFTDPGTADTHTAVWSWGDGTTSPGTVTESAGSGSAAGTHTHSAAGVYTLRLTVSDDDGASSNESVFQYVVVYDPSAGFVTGGGWIDSPPGAYAPDPALNGRATFGFVSKYLRGATTPTGNTEFQFRAANLNFHSSSFEWLVIAGARAQFRGTGTINGTGEYAFFLTAIDGQRPGGGGADRFRIKIWDRATGGVVYDNQTGAADDADPTTTLGGGSITIHS